MSINRRARRTLLVLIVPVYLFTSTQCTEHITHIHASLDCQFTLKFILQCRQFPSRHARTCDTIHRRTKRVQTATTISRMLNIGWRPWMCHVVHAKKSLIINDGGHCVLVVTVTTLVTSLCWLVFPSSCSSVC